MSDTRDSTNSHGQAIRKCSKCKCKLLLETFFEKNRQGEWKKMCEPCLAKVRAYRKANDEKKEHIIYPITPRHYQGCVNPEKKRFAARIRIKQMSVFYQSAETYDDAFRLLKAYNIDNGLTIKNIIIDKGAHYEVLLSKGKAMLFDKDMIAVVQSYLIFADVRDNTTYARTRNLGAGGGSPLMMHNIIMAFEPHDGLTVDHINGNGLDNRKTNLRIANQSTQMRNTARHDNTSGHRGVCYNKSNDCWSAQFKRNCQRYRKTFSVKKYPNAKELAITWIEQKKLEIIPENERSHRTH